MACGNLVDTEATYLKPKGPPGICQILRVGAARADLPHVQHILDIEEEGQIERAHTRNEGDDGVGVALMDIACNT
jgi:hypothetical protein